MATWKARVEEAQQTQFVSMEKALEGRVMRLEREKEKLVADFNAQMIEEDEEHTKTKIELSAWKLEVSYPSIDIPLMKK